MSRPMLRNLVTAAASVAAGTASAHPGHGQDALLHGHASDAWVIALGLLAGAVTLWWVRHR